MLTLYRVEMSTNVERVALALAHKGLKVCISSQSPLEWPP